MSLILQSTLSKTDAFGTNSKCRLKSDVRVIQSKINGVKKGRDKKSRCPFYRRILLTEVSVKREWTVPLKSTIKTRKYGCREKVLYLGLRTAC